MELEFLGTSSAASTITRNVSCLAFHYKHGVFLFDCGEGTTRQLLKSHVKPSNIESIFITHNHGDHVYGLPGLAMRTCNIKEEINVFAPSSLTRIIGDLFVKHNHFKFHEIVKFKDNSNVNNNHSKKIQFNVQENCYNVYENELLTVKAVPIRHSVFTLGYVIEEKPVRGRMLIEKIVNELLIPQGPQLKQFYEKKEFTTDSGKLVRSADYFAPARNSRKIVILGDTFDPRNISSLAMNADVLVHEATCSNEERNIALEYGHSTSGMAGEFAKKIKAKNLILTHFSPRNFANEYEEVSHVKKLLDQAKETFQNDSVYAAKDFWRVAIPFERMDEI